MSYLSNKRAANSASLLEPFRRCHLSATLPKNTDCCRRNLLLSAAFLFWTDAVSFRGLPNPLTGVTKLSSPSIIKTRRYNTRDIKYKNTIYSEVEKKLENHADKICGIAVLTLTKQWITD